MDKSLELIIRTLCDIQPECPTNGAYLYCQTASNQKSLFRTAQSLVKNSLAPTVLVLQANGKNGYPGFSEWKNELHQIGIPVEQIEGVEIDNSFPLNTLTESVALVRYALKKKYSSLFVVAPPFQQLRAFMTAATVALREYPEISLFSYPGVAMPWQEEVVHSQGTLKATRSELIHMEFERISKYQDKGDLASFEEVMNYLNKRQMIS